MLWRASPWRTMWISGGIMVILGDSMGAVCRLCWVEGWIWIDMLMNAQVSDDVVLVGIYYLSKLCASLGS